MNKLFTLVFLLITSIGFAQITVTPVKKEEPKKILYDSTYNFPGKKIESLIGQTLFLKPRSKTLQKYGYEDFINDYTKTKYKKGNVYKKIVDGFNSHHDSLAGRSFVLKNIYDKEGYEPKLELLDEKRNETIYFQYSPSYESSFPFLIQGYFDKIKSEKIGLTYVNRKDKKFVDLKTGDSIVLKMGEFIKIKDLTLEDKYYSINYIIEDKNNNQFLLRPYWLKNKMFIKSIYDKIKTKYPAYYKFILKGTVKIGMTKEAVILSWGKPKDKNISSYQEQWIYDGNYLYFKNGKLTAFN